MKPTTTKGTPTMIRNDRYYFMIGWIGLASLSTLLESPLNLYTLLGMYLLTGLWMSLICDDFRLTYAWFPALMNWCFRKDDPFAQENRL